MLKNELNNIKLEETMINYKRLNKINEYDRNLNQEKLLEKIRRFDEYK